MKVSVIVTTYNRPDALTLVLRGLSRQRRTPDQVIVADDGSSDATRQCLKAIQAETGLAIRHEWQPDKGFRAARIRNRAIYQADGEYLVLMDGDCVPDVYFIHDHLRLARTGFFFQGKRVLVKTSRLSRFNPAEIGKKRLAWLFCPGFANRHHMLRLPWFPTTVSRSLSGIRSCNMGVFRSDVMAVNGFNEDFTGWGREDSELVVRLYNYGLKRRGHPFAAICFHLWHQEHLRDRLAENDRLLENAMESVEYVCDNGILKGEDIPAGRNEGKTGVSGKVTP
jgi:glycosyltransferase involved in cell wall biosynthesis